MPKIHNEAWVEVWRIDQVFDKEHFVPVCDLQEYYDPRNVYKRLHDNTYWHITVDVDETNQMCFTSIDEVKPVTKTVTVYVPAEG